MGGGYVRVRVVFSQHRLRCGESWGGLLRGEGGCVVVVVWGWLFGGTNLYKRFGGVKYNVNPRSLTMCKRTRKISI
jgi:hypothetical protein